MIKLFDPDVTEEEVAAASEVLLSRNWASGAGLEKVRAFESEFSEYVKADTVVTVNSGTAALHLALAVVSPTGRDVLVPSLSFVSTAHAATLNGATPVFVDVDPTTLCMDPSDVERKIEAYDASAVIPVHFGGMPCDLDTLREICTAHDTHLIEDAAHACGSTYNGKRIGSISEMTCFSFHPVKNLAMPTGGAISICSSNAYSYKNKLLSLRWCGIDCRKDVSYDVTSFAPNYYMNEVSAAIGLVQLKKLERLNNRKREIARRYYNEIKLGEKMPYSDSCVYHLYWVLSRQRDDLIKHLKEKGIESGVHYRPINTMSVYKNLRSGVPVSEKVGNEIVTIPIHTNLCDDDVTYIIECINNFARK